MRQQTNLPWLELSSRIRVAVIGDIILDEYLEGSVTRISPEAPVPVHLVKGASHSAGGAANAARNISLAGGEAYLFGVCGKDEAAAILLKLLQKDKVHTDCILSVEERPTNRKTRVTSSNHQIVRIDWEKVQTLENKYQSILLEKLNEREFDAVLVSDYGKGLLPKELLSHIFKFARDRKIPCIVDPKGVDYSRYLGCSIMTPNLRECYIALGLDEDNFYTGEELGRRLQEQIGLNDILVTMGAQGMVYVPKDLTKQTVTCKATAKEVFDVSGAGDTVAAILSLGLAAGAACESVVPLSNLAAAVVVGKWGTQAVTEEEMKRALYLDNKKSLFDLKSKIFPMERVSQLRENFQATGLKVVFTNGCFDILHAGHVDYLEKAKSLGDVLVVGVNTDESIQKLKGEKRPIVELHNRMRVLSALSCIDYVIPFSEETPLSLIQKLSPNILVKGADYVKENIVGGDHVLGTGGSVETIELVPGLSTSKIVDKIYESYSKN